MPRREPRTTRRKALTDLAVKAARPEALPFAIYDVKLPNLALVVHPTGTKAFKCRYSRHGKARWFDIGKTSAVPLADARKMAAQVMLKVASGEDPHAERRAKRNAGTFAELVESYVRERGTKSVKQYQAQLDRWAVPRWGRMPAGEVTRADVRRLFEERKGQAPGSAKLLLAAISGAYAWALHRDWAGVSINPARGIASAKMDESLKYHARERVLSDDEIVSFWHQWEASGLLRCMALRAILLTGQRPGEVSNMRLEDIDGSWWTLPGRPTGTWPGTKNAQTHKVWLTDDVLALIEEASGSRTKGPVFLTPRGNPVTGLPEAMAAACKTLGIEDRATPHDLRRTFSTLVTRLGFDRDAMNRVTNHREGGIGSVYDRHDYAAEARAIQERVGRHVAGLLSGEPDSEVIELAARR